VCGRRDRGARGAVASAGKPRDAEGRREGAGVAGEDMIRVTSLAQLAEVTGMLGEAFVRFSAGPAVDRAHASVDKESGCVLPGLSVNPLRPEPWWDRPVEHWLARQLCQYLHLREGDRFGWVLGGRVVGRGPDCEPLVVDVAPVAVLDDEVVREAQRVYREIFDPGRV
jgi:hypothetical protein